MSKEFLMVPFFRQVNRYNHIAVLSEFVCFKCIRKFIKDLQYAIVNYEKVY